MKARTVASIMRHVASRLPTFDADATDAPSDAKKGQEKEAGGGDGAVTDEIAPPVGPSEEERLEKLYEQIAWPLGRKYGNMYDAFKLALTQVFPRAFSLFGRSLPFICLFHLSLFRFCAESQKQSLQRFHTLCRKQRIIS